MIIREIIAEEDLPEIARWFETHRWPFPAVPGIGPGLGIIAEEDGVLYACAWIYITGRSLAYIDWLATNPDTPREQNNKALELVIEKIKETASNSSPPVKALCLITKNKSLAQKLMGLKFKREEGFYKLLWTSK